MTLIDDLGALLAWLSTITLGQVFALLLRYVTPFNLSILAILLAIRQDNLYKRWLRWRAGPESMHIQAPSTCCEAYSSLRSSRRRKLIRLGKERRSTNPTCSRTREMRVSYRLDRRGASTSHALTPRTT